MNLPQENTNNGSSLAPPPLKSSSKSKSAGRSKSKSKSAGRSKSKSANTRPNINNALKKKILASIIPPHDKYQYYDDGSVPDNLVEAFQKPIGIYDPFGENINPLTGLPYTNVWKNSPKPWTLRPREGGLTESVNVPMTYTNVAYMWTGLPLYKYVGELVRSIRENRVTIIQAGTGVGKSFLAGRLCSHAMNYQKKVIMTLPKKIVAKEAAEGTAQSSDVVMGEEVGYFYRGGSERDKGGKESKILFTTVGTLIVQVTRDDPLLSNYGCVIVDEAHERSIETDILILYLKEALKKRADLKVVFISATLAVDTFKNYFNEFGVNIVDVVGPPTKPITDIYEDKKPVDWIKRATEITIDIMKKGKEGDILIFVKSGGDASKIIQQLRPLFKSLPPTENPYIAPVLQSRIGDVDKKLAMDQFLYRTSPDAEGYNPDRPFTRKIVMATNVAESSLTVDGVVHMIDCGFALESMYKPLQDANALLEKDVSWSSRQQRRGRVGRTLPGTAYHLYTEAEMNKLMQTMKYPIPSIQKSDLTSEILTMFGMTDIKNVADVKKLLDSMISPPGKEFVDSALLNLQTTGCITSMNDQGTLTDMGKALRGFSGFHPAYSRAALASYYYQCKREVLAILTIMTITDGQMKELYARYKPKGQMSPEEKKRDERAFEKKQHQFDSSLGDFMTIHNMYQAYRNFIRPGGDRRGGPRNRGDRGPRGPRPPKFDYLNDPRKGLRQNNVATTSAMRGGADDEDAPPLLFGNSIEDEGEFAPVEPLSPDEIPRISPAEAKRWCLENGINPRTFVGKGGSKLDRVYEDSQRLQRSLMQAVQPAELRSKNFKAYQRDGGLAEKTELKEEAKEEKNNNKGIAPEENIPKLMNREDVAPEEEEAENIHSKRGINDNVMEGGARKRSSIIQFGGYNAKPYEKNFFPHAKPFDDLEENILMAMAEGFYVHLAKHVGKGMYKTCIPLQKTMCTPDRDSSVSLTVKPKVLMYNELFMIREDAKSLKLNMVSKIPTKVMAVIKEQYGTLIENCMKEEKINNRGDRKGRGNFKGRRGDNRGDRRGDNRGDRRGDRQPWLSEQVDHRGRRQGDRRGKKQFRGERRDKFRRR